MNYYKSIIYKIKFAQNIMENRPNHSRLKIILTFLFLCFVLLLCCGGTIATFYLLGSNSTVSDTSTTQDYIYSYGDSNSTNKLLSIQISGVILDVKPEDNIFSTLASQEVTYGYDIKAKLKEAALDKSISGIILEISSPGGTIAGSKAISDGVAAYKEKTGNPVISHVIGMAASGAYWAASSTDNIIADSGSLIGSIGVILGPFQEFNKVISIDSVSTENGIEEFYITSGTFKDFGNPFRKMTAEEKSSLQEGVTNTYDIFVNYVSKQRGIPQFTIKNQIKALVYDNKKALEFKLIDSTGTQDEAYAFLAEKAGFNTDFQIVKLNSQSDFFTSLFGSLINRNNLTVSNPKNICPNLCNKPVAIYGDPVKLDK